MTKSTKRKKPYKKPGDTGDAHDVADHLLRGSIDRTLICGPLLCRPEIKGWYFFICGCGPKGFRHDHIITGETDYAQAEARRAEVLQHLVLPGVVMHIVDDELELARMGEALWPGEHITRLRKQVEAERSMRKERRRERGTA
jgi:hypothetical protein